MRCVVEGCVYSVGHDGPCADRKRVPRLTDQGYLRRRRILMVLGARGPLPVRHIGDAIGLSSPGSTQHHLELLKSTGLISHVSGWQLTDAGREALEEE